MIFLLKRFFFFIFIYFLLIVKIQAIETKSDSAIILDVNSNTILFEKNVDLKQGPASMSKLMTIYIVFEALRTGTINFETNFIVSEKHILSVICFYSQKKKVN